MKYLCKLCGNQLIRTNNIFYCENCLWTICFINDPNKMILELKMIYESNNQSAIIEINNKINKFFQRKEIFPFIMLIVPK